MYPMSHDAMSRERRNKPGRQRISETSGAISQKALFVFDDLGVPTDQIARYFKVGSADVVALRARYARDGREFSSFPFTSSHEAESGRRTKIDERKTGGAAKTKKETIRALRCNWSEMAD